MSALQPLQEAHAVCPSHGRTALKPTNRDGGGVFPEQQISIKAIKRRRIVSAPYSNTPRGMFAINSRALIHRAQ